MVNFFDQFDSDPKDIDTVHKEREIPTYKPQVDNYFDQFDTQDDKGQTAGDYALETVKNIPGSGLEMVKGIAGAVANPIDTVKGIGSVAVGGVQKLIPGEQDQEKDFDAFIGHYADRYGTMDDALETLKKDPVGTMSDVSALFSGAGGLLSGTKFGKTMASIGSASDPVLNAAKLTKRIAEKTPQYIGLSKTPAEMYQSAVKFSTTLDDATRQKLAKTALESGIMPTSAGMDKLYTNIRNIDSEISMLIDKANLSGKTLDVDDLFKGFDKLENDAMLSATPKSKKAAIQNIKSQIQETMTEMGKDGYTPAEAQKLKQTVYKDIKEYYDKRLKEPLSVSAQKSVAKQAKGFLEEVIPEIKQLNKKDGDYISLMQALDRPVSRISNRDILGIGTPIKAGAGTAAGSAMGMPYLGTAIGFGMGIMDHPLVKARLAIALDALEKKGVNLSPKTLATLRAAYVNKGIEAEEKEE